MHKIKDKARCTMCILEMREQRKMEKPTFTKQLGRDTTTGGAQAHQTTNQKKVVAQGATRVWPHPRCGRTLLPPLRPMLLWRLHASMQ
jgi:hypothetical protein